MPQRQEIRVFRQFSVFFSGQPLPPLTDLSLVLCGFLTATRAYCSSVFCINVTRQSEEVLQPATNGDCTFAAAYPIGYMPVLSQPNPKQVAEAADAYRKFREGKAGNLKIKDEKIVKKTLLEKLPPLENISIKVRISIIIAVMSILPLVIGGMGLFGMSKDSEGLRSVYKHQMLSLNRISQIQKLMLTNQLHLTTSLLSLDPELVQKETAEMEQNIAVINNILDMFIESELNPAEKTLIDKVASDRKRYLTEALQPAISALRSNDAKLANKLINDKVNPLYKPVAEEIQKLLQFDTSEKLAASVLRHYSSRETAGALIASSIFLAMWSGKWITMPV